MPFQRSSGHLTQPNLCFHILKAQCYILKTTEFSVYFYSQLKKKQKDKQKKNNQRNLSTTTCLELQKPQVYRLSQASEKICIMTAKRTEN